MGASDCSVWAGVSFDIASEAELERLEVDCNGDAEPVDPRVRAAREAGLEPALMGCGGCGDQRHWLWIGLPLGTATRGHFGAEGELRAAVPGREVRALLDDVGGRLRAAGLAEDASLLVEFHEDH